MKDHVEISHLTKFHASRVNRDQVIELEKKNYILIIILFIQLILMLTFDFKFYRRFR